MKNVLSYQVEQLLKLNKISIDFDELNFQIQSHPTYPSLHAVTGVLDHFNIKNLALDIPTDVNTLDQLPKTFLAQIKKEANKAFVVVTKKGSSYTLTHGHKQNNTLSPEQFSELFTGIILILDKDESTQVNSSRTNKSYYKLLVYLALVFFGGTLFLVKPSINELLFLGLSFIGTYISINILQQGDGESSVLGDRLCSTKTDSKNCDAVLNSEGAELFNRIKLSDLSIIYFSSLMVTSAILLISGNNLNTTFLLSFTAVPITIFSIYYQGIILKKWCLLCLSIVLTLWLQATISIANFSTQIALDSLFITLFSLATTSALSLLLLQLFKGKKSFKDLNIKHLKFKRNFDLFNSQLKISKRIDTVIPKAKEITLGNPESPLNITVISNPLCSHCKSVHIMIEQILTRFKESIKITYRFNVNVRNKEDKATKITAKLLELFSSDIELCHKSMRDIYAHLSVEQWFEKWYDDTQSQKVYLSSLELQQNWCLEHSLNFTPAILINGRSYPKMYDRTDLIYFIEDLVENSKISQSNLEKISA